MRFLTALAGASAMLLASCSSSTTRSTTADAAATTSTPAATTSAVPSPDTEVTLVEDTVYLEMNGHEYLVDVYVPPGEGPWPVVVALHGALVFKDHSETTVIARAAAEAGILVFAPNWVAEWPSLSALSAEFIRSEEPAYHCALAFAQQEAPSYGGDPDRTIIYGHSGGATAAAQYLPLRDTDLAAGCLAQALPTPPIGAVLGDAEYFNHASFWDSAFEVDAAAMQAIVARGLDPALWPDDMPTVIRLWAAADGSFSRAFDDPWDDAGWLAQRDPDGTIREDLDKLGELDDGVITYIDSGLLLTTRLQRAGIDAAFEILPGGHNAPRKASEIVAFLLDVADKG